MATQPVKGGIRYVKPFVSGDLREARGRVLHLYKAWYRQIPALIVGFRLPLSVQEARLKLRAEFLKHKHVKDVRLIDLLVIKGQMEFTEVIKNWKQRCHIMYLFKDTALPPPKNFLSKFLNGVD